MALYNRKITNRPIYTYRYCTLFSKMLASDSKPQVYGGLVFYTTTTERVFRLVYKISISEFLNVNATIDFYML